MFVYFDQTQSAAISLSVEIGFKAPHLARAAPLAVPLEMVVQVRQSDQAIYAKIPCAVDVVERRKCMIGILE